MTKELEKGLAGDRVLGSDLGDLASWGENLDPDLKAAKAIAAALSGGPIIDWEAKRIARESQGVTRMGQKRYDRIVQTGVDHELFARLDAVAYKGKTYPGLGLQEVASTPAPKPKPKPKRKAKKLAEPSPKMKGSGPAVLSCGHTQWNHAGREDHPDQKAARKAGFCCLAAKKASALGRTPTVNWSVRGLTHPVPQSMRRGGERLGGGPGWPGLCCDPKTGLYIGGIGNDCRHTGKKRCEEHAKK